MLCLLHNHKFEKKDSIDWSFLSFQNLTKSGSNTKRIQEVNEKKLQNNWLELPQENIQFLAAYARQRWRRFSRNLRFAFGFAINIWHWDHFFLQFSHNKYAILSYKGEEKRITSETLHSTDLLPFVCSPIFPDLSHYDYFSKSLRRFSCHHTVTRTPHKGLEFLSIQIPKRNYFFLLFPYWK